MARPAVKQNKPKTLVPMRPKKTTSIRRRRRVWNKKRVELQAPDHPQDLSVRDGRPWLGPGMITIAQQKAPILPADSGKVKREKSLLVCQKLKKNVRL